jgi:hypothetical protein
MVLLLDGELPRDSLGMLNVPSVLSVTDWGTIVPPSALEGMSIAGVV